MEYKSQSDEEFSSEYSGQSSNESRRYSVTDTKANHHESNVFHSPTTSDICLKTILDSSRSNRKRNYNRSLLKKSKIKMIFLIKILALVIFFYSCNHTNFWHKSSNDFAVKRSSKAKNFMWKPCSSNIRWWKWIKTQSLPLHYSDFNNTQKVSTEM